MKKIIFLLATLSVINVASAQYFEFYDREKDQIFVIPDPINPYSLDRGLTDDQIQNIRIYTTRALNMVLDSYSSLERRRIIRKETLSYMDGALFFLTEAQQYSPTYLLIRQIESIEKRFRFFPKASYSQDLITLYLNIEKIAGNIDNIQQIRDELQNLIKKASVLDNEEILPVLESIKDLLNIQLIDQPLKEAKSLISIAKEHTKARSFKNAKKSLKLAVEPLLKLTSRGNLELAVANELAYKSYLTYDFNRKISEILLDNCLYYINKAYYLSSLEDRDKLKALINQLKRMKQSFDKKDVMKKEYEILIKELKLF